MTALAYSVEEAREILLDQVITLDSHIYLEGRREEYVRAEDHERPGIVRSSFRHIWSSAHPDWDWENETDVENNSEYFEQREASFCAVAFTHPLHLSAGHAPLVSREHAHSRGVQTAPE
ncbi:unnamed protein product [Peniophora sp. CBMAI 1063]|nr:unnamed protein product [Peniophora sp. CBMAI 1063]